MSKITLLKLDKSVGRDAPIKFLREDQEEFILPRKIYGKLDETVDRVLKTFEERDNNLGIFLSGIKGNSKTTTGKMICNKTKLPVLLITEPFVGSEFKSFLSNIKEEIIVFIDEFEKVYSTKELQQEFLSILDGVFQSKKMFIFTSNSEDINEFLKNRPSRIFYHFKYNNLDPETIDEIIDSELKNKSFEEDLRAVLMILGTISIDVILNLIDEVNRFDLSPKLMVKGLNIQVEQTHFNVTLYVKGEMVQTRCDFNPLTQDYFVLNYKNDKGHYGWYQGNFSDYVMYTKDGNFIFESSKDKMVFMPYKETKFEL